jgi:hypothetical protein
MEYKEIKEIRDCRDNLNSQITQLTIILQQACLDFIEQMTKKHGEEIQDEKGSCWWIKLKKRNWFSPKGVHTISKIGYNGRGEILYGTTENSTIHYYYRDLKEKYLMEVVDVIAKECKNK